MEINKSFSGVLRYITFIFLALLSATTIIFFGFYSQEVKSKKMILMANERQSSKLLLKIIESDLKVNAYNLIFLANHTMLHKWLINKSVENRMELSRLFLNFCKKTRMYDQIRFIDQKGQEKIRINFEKPGYVIVPDDRLQNKADRYYFKDTINLGLNQISISPFDLNMEHGKIEQPLKPMIRFGMPVHNFHGHKQGVLLLNYLGSRLIKDLDSGKKSHGGIVQLINTDGYWIKAAKPEDEWGFMFKNRRDKNISQKNPEAWKKILDSDEGQFYCDQGLYSFQTIRITGIGILRSTNSGKIPGSGQEQFRQKKFYWKIVSFVPASMLSDLSLKALLTFLPFYSLVIVIMFIISWWLGVSINQRIHTQKILDRNEAALSSLFRSVPAGIGMVNNRIIRQVNHKLCTMTGYREEELLGQNAQILYPSNEEFEYVGQEKYRQIREKGTGSVETRWKCKNGKIINILLSSTMVNPPDLNAGLTFSAFDITSRKKAEDELAANKERYQTIVETSSDGIFTVSKECILTSFNAALEILTGQKREEWIEKKSCLDLIAPGDLEAASLVLKQTLKGQSTSVHEFRLNTLTPGQYKICEFRLKPKYDKNSNVNGIVGFVKDITEYKKAREKVKRVETQLRQALKMEAIGTLAGGIAHDFNNILSGIFGYAQLAEINSEKDDKTKQYIKRIVKGAQRATALVQQILTFSRQTEYEKQPLMISITIKEALKLLRASIPTTIDIKTDITSRARVMADPTRIHQVIMNLCTNAYHAMGDTGGVLTVTLHEIELVKQDSFPDLNMVEGKYLKLTVEDTGHGIDEKIIEKIFDPYFSTKETGKGTGLGLALVQAIVDEHNGFLELESEPHRGTSFHIYLPVVEDEIQQGSAPMNGDSLVKGNEKIMFVDDEESIRSVFKDALEGYGYKVDIYNDGLLALEGFKKKSDYYDMVITDMTMPGMTGDLLAEKLMTIRPGIPVILCTGYSAKMSEAKAIELGIKKYVQKPIAHMDLAVLIRQILDEQAND